MTVKRHIPRDVLMRAEQLRQWADSLTWYEPRGDALPPAVRMKALPPFYALSDPDRWALADLLRALAHTPKVLVALEAARPRPKSKRGRKADGERNWKATLEYELVRTQRRPPRRQGKRDERTAARWKISRSQLHALHSRLSERTPENQQLGGWRDWARYTLRVFRADPKTQHLTVRRRRAALIASLRPH